MRCHTYNHTGFSLVEMMIALFISSVLALAIYVTSTSMQGSYSVQEQVSEMQQNARAAMNTMSRDFRMAGYNPQGGAKAGITAASATILTFTADLDENGDTLAANETISYTLSAAGTDGHRSLTRTSSGVTQPVADYIDYIEFFYTLDSGASLLAPAAAQRDLIRSVQISLIVRTRFASENFYNNIVYTTASGLNLPPYNDNARRRMLISTVQLRNMGL